MIESYDFGVIKINGKTYAQDVFIGLNGEIKNWLRGQSHLFQKSDVENLLKKDVRIAVFGIGKSGIAQLSDELRTFIQGRGIELVVFPTDQAVDYYNQLLQENREVVAFLHLTC